MYQYSLSVIPVNRPDDPRTGATLNAIKRWSLPLGSSLANKISDAVICCHDDHINKQRAKIPVISKMTLHVEEHALSDEVVPSAQSQFLV